MDLVVTREAGGFVVRQGGPPGPPGPAGTGGGDVTQAELDVVADAVTALQSSKQDAATAATQAELDTEAGARASGDTARQLLSEKDQANGYPSLNASGKVPSEQLAISGLSYQGVWDANTNTPTLADGTGTSGHFYIVGTAGSQDLGSGSIDFEVGDWVLHDGSVWSQVPAAAPVNSVFGRTGVITPQADDYNIAKITGLQLALDAKQPLDADLTTLAGLASLANLTSLANLSGAANKGLYFTGVGALATFDLSPYMRIAVLGSADAAALRSAAGLGTSATLNVPASGNAAAGEVVKGSDTRLGVGGGLAAISSPTADYKPTAANELGAIIQTMTTPGAVTLAPQSDTVIAVGKPIRLIRGGSGGMAVRTAYREMVLADTPALYWRLSDTSGTTANDETANNRDGGYVGTPTLGAAGALVADADAAVDLSGSGQYVTSTYNPFTIGSVRTFEGWAWRDTSTTADTLFGGDAASAYPFLRLSASSNDVTFTPANSTTTTWTAAWPGNAQWVHWVLIFNDGANTVELFINGVSVGSQAMATAYNATPGNFLLAARASTHTDPFDGKMDEVAIYTAALSAARIDVHYDAGKLIINSPDGARSVLKEKNQVELFRETGDTWWLEGSLAL